MTELISQVGSTHRGSFGNMCWRIYLFFLYAAQKRVVVLTHILPHVQVEQGCTSTVVTHSALI